MKRFDRRFNQELVSGIPNSAGVYRYYDVDGILIYVGKAKRLRRRILQYRNAKRLKAHRKMRAIIADAAKLEWQELESEEQALLLENELIQKHRPKHNVAGAFSFLYPLLGIHRDRGNLVICYTTEPGLFGEFELFGSFRSRLVVKRAFDALAELLRYVGHPAPRRACGPYRSRSRYCKVMALRNVPDEWVVQFAAFLRGESNEAMESLVLALVENAGARARRENVQAHLNDLKRLWKHEIIPLKKAISIRPDQAYPIAQAERDRLFIEARGRG